MKIVKDVRIELDRSDKDMLYSTARHDVIDGLPGQLIKLFGVVNELVNKSFNQGRLYERNHKG